MADAQDRHRLAEWAKRVRDARGWSQDDLGFLAGVSRSSIQLLERGSKVGVAVQKAIEGALKLPEAEAARLIRGRSAISAAHAPSGLVEKSPPIHPVTGERIPSNFTIRRVSRVAADSLEQELDLELEEAEGVPGALYPEPMSDPRLVLVLGNSMTYSGPDSIESGDEVLYADAVEEDIADGETVVVHHVPTDRRLVKVLQRVTGNMFRFHSLNPEHPPLDLPAEQCRVRRALIVIKKRHKRNFIPSARVQEILKSKAPNPPRNL